MTTKNDSTSSIDTASLLSVSFELYNVFDIITLSDEVNYSCLEVLNVCSMW